jgi:hypothetical protein
MFDCVKNPASSKPPVALYRANGNTQNLRCFLVRHACEVSQFDYFGLIRIFLGEIGFIREVRVWNDEGRRV